MPRSKEQHRLELMRASQSLFFTKWHYFSDHVANFTPFISCIYKACAELHLINEAAPLQMLRELSVIGGRKNFEPHFDQLMQKLAEILVMRQVVSMSWPENTVFQIEAVPINGRRRVDIVATVPDGEKYGFEVKAPSYLEYSTRRNEGRYQFPARFPGGLEEFRNINRDQMILPRDNTVRDFLRSAEQKFSGFKENGEFKSILVVVWDDWIYEALTPLVNERNGLLTGNSYARQYGVSEFFPNIDAVIVLRHLAYFVHGSREETLPDQRQDAMHFGGEGAMPNVAINNSDAAMPEFLKTGFNAFEINSPELLNMPEYNAHEFVLMV